MKEWRSALTMAIIGSFCGAVLQLSIADWKLWCLIVAIAIYGTVCRWEKDHLQ